MMYMAIFVAVEFDNNHTEKKESGRFILQRSRQLENIIQDIFIWGFFYTII